MNKDITKNYENVKYAFMKAKVKWDLFNSKAKHTP